MYYKLKNLLNQILPESDGLKHHILCMYIYLVSAQLFAIWVALLITVFVAGAVEVIDKFSEEGTPEWSDFFWGALGGVLPFLIDLWIK